MMAAYLAGSLTSDHGDRPVPDSSMARWNSKPMRFGRGWGGAERVSAIGGEEKERKEGRKRERKRQKDREIGREKREKTGQKHIRTEANEMNCSFNSHR